MNEIEVDEFVRRLEKSKKIDGSRYVFFCGAGCSNSSGIPTAGNLVKKWIPELKEMKTGNSTEYEKWAEQYLKFDPDKASLIYGRILEELFPTPKQRQIEIEKIIEGHDPSFAYAVLSKLISHKDYGKHYNVILTTNFDDLVADALYLYTNTKPLVIYHESLADFVSLSRTRPLVIKLHGDARLQPKNISEETEKLEKKIEKKLNELLSETGLIFVGYGGNDKSVVEFLSKLDSNALPWGVYWVSENLPSEELTNWLEKKNAIWVKHRDFDELMLLIQHLFELKNPDRIRFDTLINQYYSTIQDLHTKIKDRPHSLASDILRKAMNELTQKLNNPYEVVVEAEKFTQTYPERAETIFLNGKEKFKNDEYLRFRIIIFYMDYVHDLEKAEKEAKEALSFNSDTINTIYGIVLEKKGNIVEAKKQLEKGKSDYSRAHYARFLAAQEGDYDNADKIFKKLLQTSKSVDIKTDYAELLFLMNNDVEAKKMIRKARKQANRVSELIPIYFVEYIIANEKKYNEPLTRLKELLLKNNNVPTYAFLGSIKRAEQENKLNLKFIKKLREVVNGIKPVSELEKFSEWNEIKIIKKLES